MKQVIVTFCGEKGHGKSSAADCLIREGFKPIHFADGVREVAKVAFGLTDEEMDDPVIKEQPLARWPFLSPRKIMQHIGTDLFREWLGETWTRRWERDIDGVPRVVTADVRFPDEGDVIHAHDGLVIRIVNPRKASGADTHISEAGQSRVQVDAEIVNDGTLEDLEIKVLAAVTNWLKEHRA